MAKTLAQALADLEEDPFKLIEELRYGMEIVGERYKKGGYFLSELIMSGEIFRDAMSLIEPKVKAAAPRVMLGRVVIGTAQGDIHDIGKDIAATILRTAGFEVFDLGVDVVPQMFVEKIKETGATILGMSALITTSFGSMKETVNILAKEGLRDSVKVIIGGGVTTPTVREYVGADAQTLDAVEGLDLCRKFVSSGRKQ